MKETMRRSAWDRRAGMGSFNCKHPSHAIRSQGSKTLEKAGQVRERAKGVQGGNKVESGKREKT